MWPQATPKPRPPTIPCIILGENTAYLYDMLLFGHWRKLVRFGLLGLTLSNTPTPESALFHQDRLPNSSQLSFSQGWSHIYPLYRHPRLGSKFDQAYFWTLITWSHRKKSLDPWLPSWSGRGIGGVRRQRPSWPWSSSVNSRLDRLIVSNFTGWSLDLILIPVTGVSTAGICVVFMTTRGRHYISTCTSTRDRGQDLDPSNFYAWPLDRTENLALTLDYRALTTPIDRLERLWPFLSCPWFLAWPLDQLQNFALTALTPVAGGSTVAYAVSPPLWPEMCTEPRTPIYFYYRLIRLSPISIYKLCTNYLQAPCSNRYLGYGRILNNTHRTSERNGWYSQIWYLIWKAQVSYSRLSSERIWNINPSTA